MNTLKSLKPLSSLFTMPGGGCSWWPRRHARIDSRLRRHSRGMWAGVLLLFSQLLALGLTAADAEWNHYHDQNQLETVLQNVNQKCPDVSFGSVCDFLK